MSVQWSSASLKRRRSSTGILVANFKDRITSSLLTLLESPFTTVYLFKWGSLLP